MLWADIMVNLSGTTVMKLQYLSLAFYCVKVLNFTMCCCIHMTVFGTLHTQTQTVISEVRLV